MAREWRASVRFRTGQLLAQLAVVTGVLKFAALIGHG
jgi:hypothetical protein